MAAMGVSQAVGLAPDLGKAKASDVSVFGILDRKSKIDSSTNNTGLTLETVNGDIEFQHVSFKYPIRPDIQIFKGLSLSIPAGKMVALVGESGSGKSTIISLIERFYNPESGDIYLDGVEIKRLKISWLRKQMGLVSQEPTLFNDQTISRKIKVYNNKVAVLIGKGGDTIRYLQINSGAKIQIMRDSESDSQAITKPVELIGTLDCIERAEKLINDVIAEVVCCFVS